MRNAVTPVEANNSRHPREGGNPVYLGVHGCTGNLDSRLRGNDGEEGSKRLRFDMVSECQGYHPLIKWP